MSKQVVIKIEDRSFDQSFPVFLEFWVDGKIIDKDNDCPSLPKNPDIPQLYDNWKQIYNQLGNLQKSRQTRTIKTHSGATNISTLDECKTAADKFEVAVQNWLRHPVFGDIRGRIVGRLKSETEEESIRVIFDTKNYYLQRLPWEQWDLFQNQYYLPDGELALLGQYNRPSHSLKKPVKILAIFGCDQGGLKLQQDRELIENLRKYGGEITSIPSKGELTPQQLYDSLWLGHWDIIFYAGHSANQEIQLSNTLNLSVSDLREALKEAAKKAKLAIFNSCDSLGIAEYLADLDIPHLIVMREAVPDAVARYFLKFFLQEFSQGKPLNLAVRRARRRLKQMETITDDNNLFYPGASWLPVLVQNPAAPPLYWPSQFNLSKAIPWKIIFFTFALISSYSIYKFVKNPPGLWGDFISSGEEILVKTSAPRTKQRGVEFIGSCQKPLSDYFSILSQQTRQQWQNCFGTKASYHTAVALLKESWQEEGKDPETLIYLNNALLEAQNVDYYTLAVVVPILKYQDGTVKNAELAQELLRGVAQAQTEVNLGLFDGNENTDQKLSQILPGKDFLEKNSIQGKGLKVIIVDDSNSEKESREQAKALVEQSEVLGIVGPYASEMTMASVDIYNDNKLPLVSPGTTTPELNDFPRRFFFRTIPIAPVQAADLADFFIKNTQGQAAILYNPKSAYANAYQKEFKRILREAGRTVLNLNHFDLSKSNFSASTAIKEIRKTEDAVIVLVPDGQVTNALTNAIEVIQENQGQNSILASWTIYSPKTLAISDLTLLEPLVMAAPWHYLSSPNTNFPQQTQKLWGGPVSPRTAFAYDAARALINAIKSHKKPTRTHIQITLANPNFTAEGATGTIQFDKNGDRKNPAMVLVHVVPCQNQQHGLAFVPIKYPTAEAAGLKCESSE